MSTSGQTPTFFFYDLETTGLNPREARIMQFAGQRTDLELKPVDDPVNILVTITPDILPEPDAIMVTGITPQATMLDGLTEAAFLQHFENEIATPGTIFAGYNTVRFDDEFMRYLHYRNFYDPYAWGWQDGKSRWDLIDVVRMTRALRPEGIEWPFAPDGKPSNRLELLTAVNKLDHQNAHDALSDVNATIAVARMISARQPKLFQYLLTIRGKREVAAVVESGEPFVHTANQYSSTYEKTSIAVRLGDHPKKQGAFIYDLRFDPDAFLTLSPQELAEAWRWKKPDEMGLRLPVHTIQYNQCPAIAPLGVLSQTAAEQQTRLQLDMRQIMEHRKKLSQASRFMHTLYEAYELMEEKRQSSMITDSQAVDAQLYDGFLGDQDRDKARVVVAADPRELSTLDLKFGDSRLSALLPLYKARNYPKLLTDEERGEWENFRKQRLLGGGAASRMARYFDRLQSLSVSPSLTNNQRYLLEELRLYGEMVMPVDDDM